MQTLIFISVVLFVHLGFKTWADASFEMVSLGISEKMVVCRFTFHLYFDVLSFLQAQTENYNNKFTYLPAIFYVISAVIIFAILFFQPEWFKMLRISNYIKLGSSAVYVVLAVLVDYYVPWYPCGLVVIYCYLALFRHDSLECG